MMLWELKPQCIPVPFLYSKMGEHDHLFSCSMCVSLPPLSLPPLSLSLPLPPPPLLNLASGSSLLHLFWSPYIGIYGHVFVCVGGGCRHQYISISIYHAYSLVDHPKGTGHILYIPVSEGTDLKEDLCCNYTRRSPLSLQILSLRRSGFTFSSLFYEHSILLLCLIGLLHRIINIALSPIDHVSLQ